MEVKLIAITQALVDDGSPEAVIEYAGRICYRSVPKSESSRERFIRRRVMEGHESIVEHAAAAFGISGISRACSHQLVRHRLASYSQESQRYVGMSSPEWVVPDSIDSDPQALDIFRQALEGAASAYRALVSRGIKKEDARFLLPNAAATRIVVTMNFRELLHFFRIRISTQAQREIRQLALAMLAEVYPYGPSVFRGEVLRAENAFLGEWVMANRIG